MSQTNENNQAMLMEDEAEIDLVELFYYMSKRIIWLVLALVIGGVIAGGISYHLIIPKYEATAKVYMVSASSDSLINLSDLNLGTSLSADYAEMLQIRPVYEDVTEKLNLDYTYEDFLKLISISTVGNTRILEITAETEDPKESMNIANRVADNAVNYLPDLMETAEPNIAEYAITPDKPSSPNMIVNTLAGALVGLLLMGGIFMVRFIMDDTFKSAEDIERVFGLMPLTVIPESDSREMKSKKHKRKKRR